MLWNAIAQAKLPVRISTCMIVASPCVPNVCIALKNAGPPVCASATSDFRGNAETNANDVTTYSTPRPMTLISVARGTFRTGSRDSSA